MKYYFMNISHLQCFKNPKVQTFFIHRQGCRSMFEDILVYIVENNNIKQTIR